MAAVGSARCKPLEAALSETSELLDAVLVGASTNIPSHPRRVCIELLEKQAERVAHESARVGVTMPMDLDAKATATIVGGFVDAYAKLVTACQLYCRFCGPLLAKQLRQAVRRIVEACGTQVAQWLVALGGKCPSGPIQDAMVSSSKWKQASYALVQERCAALRRLPRTDVACALRTVMQLAVVLKDTLKELDECLPARPALSAIQAVLCGDAEAGDDGADGCAAASGSGAAASACGDKSDDDDEEEELDAVAAEAAHRCKLVMRGLRAWAGACVKEVRAVTASRSKDSAEQDEAIAAFDGKGAGCLDHMPAVVQLQEWLVAVEEAFAALQGPIVDLGELASSSAEDVPSIQTACTVLAQRVQACGALLAAEVLSGDGWEVPPAATRAALGAIETDTDATALLMRLVRAVEACRAFCVAVLSDDMVQLQALCADKGSAHVPAP